MIWNSVRPQFTNEIVDCVEKIRPFKRLLLEWRLSWSYHTCPSYPSPRPWQHEKSPAVSRLGGCPVDAICRGNCARRPSRAALLPESCTAMDIAAHRGDPHFRRRCDYTTPCLSCDHVLPNPLLIAEKLRKSTRLSCDRVLYHAALSGSSGRYFIRAGPFMGRIVGCK